MSKSYKVFVAKQIKESVSEAANTKMFLTFGRVTEWANEEAPDQANTSHLGQIDFWNTMVGGKRIFENDIEHVIPRIDWTAGTSYDQYDDRDENLFDRNFYVLTSDNNVYKCLSNNTGGLSTVEPTSETTSSTTQTSDDYVWKFMYKMNSEDKHRFMNSEYMPVRELVDDNGSLQYDIQSSAISGQINTILIDNAGNYTTDNITISIVGDGSGANAYASVNVTSNSISNVIVDTAGLGYTYADVTISGGGGNGGGSVHASISPFGGNGSDALRELGGSNLMINAEIRGTENGELPIVNNFRRVGIITNPYIYGTSNVYTNTAYTTTTDLTLTGVSSDFEEDETVFQGGSLLTSTFKGTVVEWNSANSFMRLIDTEGTATAASLIGDTSGATAYLASETESDLVKYSGQVLYIDNIEEIKRNELQTENFRIILKY